MDGYYYDDMLKFIAKCLKARGKIMEKDIIDEILQLEIDYMVHEGFAEFIDEDDEE